MDRFNRIYRLHGILANRRTPIPLKHIKNELECSLSTAQRCIDDMRYYLDAPLEYDRKYNGWYYNQKHGGKPYQLPGLWFSEEELNGLLICRQFLKDISPGLLHAQINQLHDKITALLATQHQTHSDIGEYIEIITTARRLKDDSHFKKIATALFRQKQFTIDYDARSDDDGSKQRRLSPQKLIYYRDNWYLLAWCHMRSDLRIFSIDIIHSVKTVDDPIIKIDPQTLERFTHASYGIFSGEAIHTAVLVFSKKRARWVADEIWHRDQQGVWLENGGYQLSIPFSDSRELIMDILKQGAEVEVIAPEFLRERIKQQIDAMQKIYKK